MEANKTGYPSIDRLHDRGFGYFERNPIIPDMSISNLITLLNLFNMDSEAVDMINSHITYFEMNKEKKIMARALKELGIKQGDVITVCMNNTYQAILTFLAANSIGAVTTFLNYRASEEEIQYYLNEFESPLLVNYNKSREYNEIIKRNTKLENVITLKKENLYAKRFTNDVTNLVGYSSFIKFSDLLTISKYYNGFINTFYSGKNDALLLFTSGSSGNPKTVVLTNENVIANGIYCKNTINLPQSKKERCLSFVPFKYPYGFATSVLLTFLCGRTVVLTPEGLMKENACDILKDINYYYGSPALLSVMRNIVPQEMDLSSGHTFVTGGDFFTKKTEELGKTFFAEHNNPNIVFCNGAGNAETVATWSSSVGAVVKPGTVGRILVGSDPVVVDPTTGNEVKYGENGILLISGKHVFKGYYKNDDLTKEEMVKFNGKEYYNTRTIGNLDEERYFTLIGRESRFYILSDGNKVYCERVQDFISLIDIVENCIVVRKTNDTNLYEGKAYVVLKQGVMPDENTRSYIGSKFSEILVDAKGKTVVLNDFEIPSSIEFVDKIELTDADKMNYTYYEQLADEEYIEDKKEVKRREFYNRFFRKFKYEPRI